MEEEEEEGAREVRAYGRREESELDIGEGSNER